MTTPTIAEVAGKLPAGSRRAVLAMTDKWQFCGKATFNANGAWNASWSAEEAVERMLMKDGKWSRYAYRLTPLGIQLREYLSQPLQGTGE